MSRGAEPSRVGAPTVATFVSDAPLVAGREVALGEEAAHHMRVRRLEVGEAIRLRDGGGRAGEGRLVRLAKSQAVVALDAVRELPPVAPVHLLVPVGDRDRMLWTAEKAVEIGLASWRPVLFRRSRSVGARGEGAAFQQKVRARMASALAQSEAGWLPALVDDAAVERAAAETPAGVRLVLDPEGLPFDRIEPPTAGGAVTIAAGPEGGIEPDELAALEAAGFRRAALPGNILRFETAAVLGVAFAHALLARAARG